MSHEKPFAGLKVVDLSQGIAGPYCGMLLAQQGADVIKVEPPAVGDWSRTLGTRYGDQTAFSIAGNLGKRGIAIDLKRDEGKGILWTLLKGADILIEGFRPGVLSKLGFGYEAVAEREPGILYLSISGFGQKGPWAERPAMDPILQAYTGMMIENKGGDGVPHRVAVIVIDMATGLYAHQALSGAIYARREGYGGRHIDASLLQSAASLQAVRMMASVLEEGAVRTSSAPGGVFRTSDGWLNLVVVSDADWIRLCEALDVPAIATDRRFHDNEARCLHEEELYAILRPLIAARPTGHWCDRLAAARIMHQRLNSYSDFVAEPQVVETGAIAWLSHPGVGRAVPMPNIVGLPPFPDGEARAAAPGLGEHTDAILREHGYGSGEIAGMRDGGVIA